MDPALLWAAHFSEKDPLMAIKKFAAVLVLGALALAPAAQPSQAASGGAVGAHQVSRAAAPPLIRGVVSDQFGHYVDNVDVEAVRANGNVAASSLTYASSWDSGPQHGFFYLEVGKKGTYTLTLSKDGFVPRTLESVEITRLRQRLSLGEITLKRKLAATTTSGELRDESVTTSDKPRVDVSVKPGKAKPAGTVEIRIGSKVVGSATVKAADKGSTTVTLGKFAKGSYTLKAYYLGSKTTQASSSKAMTLSVKKARGHHRPNAW